MQHTTITNGLTELEREEAAKMGHTCVSSTISNVNSSPSQFLELSEEWISKSSQGGWHATLPNATRSGQQPPLKQT